LKITGIICEYNPLHLGHQKQLDLIRKEKGEESGIVCLMSGHYVQRGAPAIVHKMLRAQAALECGADLVLEMPVYGSLSSAEGFATRGVEILSPFCDTLCFGAETADEQALMQAAQALLTEEFSQKLRVFLDEGLSFPAAREKALTQMGISPALLQQPNNILAVEYCKAILAQKSSLDIFVIPRRGDYHALEADAENPSATALRRRMEAQEEYLSYLPECTRNLMTDVTLHSLRNAETAILAKLRTMTDEEFEAIPYGSEGLWRKLMKAARTKATLDEIIDEVKSKRYTRTRIDRMILCAYLGITAADLHLPTPYVRVLALNDRGREILNKARQTGEFINIGQSVDHPYQLLENRCASLYGLFAQSLTAPNAEKDLRIYYKA